MVQQSVLRHSTGGSIRILPEKPTTATTLSFNSFSVLQKSYSKLETLYLSLLIKCEAAESTCRLLRSGIFINYSFLLELESLQYSARSQDSILPDNVEHQYHRQHVDILEENIHPHDNNNSSTKEDRYTTTKNASSEDKSVVSTIQESQKIEKNDLSLTELGDIIKDSRQEFLELERSHLQLQTRISILESQYKSEVEDLQATMKEKDKGILFIM